MTPRSCGVGRNPTDFLNGRRFHPTASTTVLSTVPAKEDRMQAQTDIPDNLNEVITEITLILARGYMRYRQRRHLAADSGSSVDDIVQVEESEVLTEKRLDCSEH